MFEHGLTHKKYYSIREKINYYSKALKGNDKALKDKAKKRLPELQKLNSRNYNEPMLIITDDKHFGNKIHKPRLCVSIKEDKKGGVLIAPIHRRTSKAILLENYEDRQLNFAKQHIDKSEIYETKYITNVKPLTKSDITHIKRIYK